MSDKKEKGKEKSAKQPAKWLNILLGVVTATGGFLDAGTISTSGAAGALFGLGLIWAIVLATLAAILLVEMSGRLAAVSGRPYGGVIRERFGFSFYLLPLASELIAETLLLAAEIGGVAIAISLITGLSWRLLFPFVALGIWILLWRSSFSVIENGPAIIGIIALATIAAVVALGGPPPSLLPTLWHPDVQQGEWAEYLYLAAAIMGSTISPYLLYFYSSGAVEEGWSRDDLGLNRLTAGLGMGFGSLCSIAVVVLAAVVLRPHGIQANTLGEIGLPMGQAFGPVGGILFAVILFATCLGAAFEVSLSLSYNIAQGFGWEWGEGKRPVEAARFNVVLTALVIVAALIGLFAGDPLRLAVFASTLLALFLPFSLSPLLIIMNDREYLGEHTNGRFANIATIAVLAMAFLVAVVSIPLLILSGGGG
ncbi:MAG TPA: divalent metal cation transporter [Ktedonobacterales bacterium]|jgi:Mn2+/Fe2+ NRAMP family transporter|nr:divalent metal cation transporter [Ktedonobacterales bacterium]